MKGRPKKPLILIIDNEPLIRRLLKKGLEQYGFEVHAAAHGAAALALAARMRFDLVLLDLAMSESSPTQTILGLQSAQPDMPILLMTTGAPDSLIEEGLAFGALGPLVKPFPIEGLKARIAGLLSTAT
jgi:DNA-binding response OmpR family regulator